MSMPRGAYTVLGWAVWQIATRVAKRKLAQNRVQLGVAGALVLAGAIALVSQRSRGDD